MLPYFSRFHNAFYGTARSFYQQICFEVGADLYFPCGSAASRTRLPHLSHDYPHLAHDYFWTKMRSNAETAGFPAKIGCFLLRSKMQSCERCRKSQENRDFQNSPGAKRKTLTLYQNKRLNVVAATDLLEFAKTHLPILLGTQVTVSRKQLPRPVHRIH